MSGLVGQKIDVYEIVRLLGKGGMGEVYEARHTLIGRTCAIKVLSPDENMTEELLARMVREARAASMLGHPNIVQIYDFRMDSSGRFFMAMELLEGRSLADLMSEHHTFTSKIAASITLQILSALAAAHAKGVVHRDLKPDNIFLATDSTGNAKVKLLDFGISKFTSKVAGDMRLTQTGAVLGTPYYMSPEQAEGRKDLDTRSDLWSCGTILYEMVTGRVPFYGESYNQVMAAILMKPYTPPRCIAADLEPGFERIIMKAMEKDPENRYASASEFFKDLLPYHSAEEIRVGSLVLMPPYTGTNPVMSFERMVAAASSQPFDPEDSSPVPLESILVNPPSVQVGAGNAGKAHITFKDGEARNRSLFKVLLAATGGLAFVGAIVASIIIFSTSSQKQETSVGSSGKFLSADKPAPSDLSLPEDGGFQQEQETGGDPGESSESTETIDPVQVEDPRETDHPAKGGLKEMHLELVGLPKNARVVLDDEPVDPPIKMDADGKIRCVKVWGRNRGFFEQCFVADGDKSFKVVLKRSGGRTHKKLIKKGDRPSVYDNPYE